MRTSILRLDKSVVAAFTAAFVCAAAGACASKPVEVNTSAVIMLDTAHRTAATLRKAAPAKNFWDAMTSLDPDYTTSHPVKPEEKDFAAALRWMMLGDADEAELILDSLARHATDSLVRSASHILLTAALQYQDRWNDLANIAPRRERKDSTDVDRAGVELWASAFKSVPQRTIDFPAREIIVPLLISAAGTPMIELRINGKPKQFWLDTGSSMSIVSSDVAAECEIQPLAEDTLEVATATGRIAARPAAIRKLEIGAITVNNSTAMIVADRLMRIRTEAQNPAGAMKIDGIIGFDILSRFNMYVDYGRRVVRLSKPVKTVSTRLDQRNLFWIGTPVVRLVTSRGIPLHLGLDTGSQETYATEAMLDKVRTQTFFGERKRVGGFAGLREFRGRFISNLTLSLRGRNVVFQKVLVFVPALSTFVVVDGMLGSDIARTGVMRIDAVNGIFSLEAST